MDETTRRIMIMKHVRIQLETTQTEKKSSVPIDTSYWEKLWDTYTTDFASVEIHSWLEEPEQIEELSKISANSVDARSCKGIHCHIE